MARSSTRSIGIDPAYEIADDVTIGPDATLYMETSDDYFAGDHALTAFDEPVIDLAFIDGLHLYEFVLRDFMNVEKYAAPGSVIIFDDVLPRATVHAARDRETRTWTGDVWKIIPTLRDVRPDLILLLVRTTPTGLLLVLGGDLTNEDLATAYDLLLDEHVSSSHEPPAEIITRSTAVYPTWVVAAPFWDVLRNQREQSISPADGREELLASLQQWASTTLNDKQAKAIHPSLTGKPAPAPAKAKAKAKNQAAAAKPEPVTARPAPAASSTPVALGGRVINGLRWRAKKLVRVTKLAVAEYRKPANS